VSPARCKDCHSVKVAFPEFIQTLKALLEGEFLSHSVSSFSVGFNKADLFDKWVRLKQVDKGGGELPAADNANS
jgi:hypothetical protein